MNTSEIDLADVVTEVTDAFNRYKNALVSNDLEALGGPVPRRSAHSQENLYGHAEIRAFRAGRSPAGPMRKLSKTVIMA